MENEKELIMYRLQLRSLLNPSICLAMAMSSDFNELIEWYLQQCLDKPLVRHNREYYFKPNSHLEFCYPIESEEPIVGFKEPGICALKIPISSIKDMIRNMDAMKPIKFINLDQLIDQLNSNENVEKREE